MSLHWNHLEFCPNYRTFTPVLHPPNTKDVHLHFFTVLKMRQIKVFWRVVLATPWDLFPVDIIVSLYSCCFFLFLPLSLYAIFVFGSTCDFLNGTCSQYRLLYSPAVKDRKTGPFVDSLQLCRGSLLGGSPCLCKVPPCYRTVNESKLLHLPCLLLTCICLVFTTCKVHALCIS